MSTTSTESTPFSLAYICELLRVDESQVLYTMATLGITPHKEAQTGRLLFSKTDVDRLKQSVQQRPSQQTTRAVADANNSPSEMQTSTVVPVSTAPVNNPPSTAVTAQQTASTVTHSASRTTGSSLSPMSRTDLSVIVDAVSNAKEGILRDLSHLLDDKLSGLDDVVVELIRSKSENDALREELRRIQEHHANMQSELGKFKPAAFGFYRKSDQ